MKVNGFKKSKQNKDKKNDDVSWKLNLSPACLSQWKFYFLEYGLKIHSTLNFIVVLLEEREKKTMKYYDKLPLIIFLLYFLISYFS